MHEGERESGKGGKARRILSDLEKRVLKITLDNLYSNTEDPVLHIYQDGRRALVKEIDRLRYAEIRQKRFIRLFDLVSWKMCTLDDVFKLTSAGVLDNQRGDSFDGMLTLLDEINEEQQR